MILECQTLDEFYQRLQRSFEGNNYVNRVEVKGGHESKDYPNYTFETLPGFVQDQRERRGRITFEYKNGSRGEISRTATIQGFLAEIFREYEGNVYTDFEVSAKLHMDGVPNQQEPLEFRLDF